MYRTKSEQKAPQNHHTVSFGFIVYLHDKGYHVDTHVSTRYPIIITRHFKLPLVDTFHISRVQLEKQLTKRPRPSQHLHKLVPL